MTQHHLAQMVTPVHLAAVSVGSALAAAVSFAVDGPTISAVVGAAVLMGGAVRKVYRESVAAAAEVQVLRIQVAEQAKQIATLELRLNRQGHTIREHGQ